MGADTRNIADGEEIRVKVQSATRQITELTGKVQDGRVEVEWEIEAFEEEQQEEKEQEQRKQQEEEQNGIISKYYTDVKGNIIHNTTIGKEIYLVIKSRNLVGKKIDIDLSDNTKDFEYQGKRLENDILRDILIEEDYQKIPLKVIKPQKEAQKQ